MAGCRPATASARPVSTLQAMPSLSIEPLAFSVIIAAFGSDLVAFLDRGLRGAEFGGVHCCFLPDI